MDEKSIAGACLCGAVRFELGGPLERVAHCHCTICQRAHGAAFATWVAVPNERLRITAGEESVVHYRSSEIGTRSFCRTCGSSMFCTLDTSADPRSNRLNERASRDAWSATMRSRSW